MVKSKKKVNEFKARNPEKIIMDRYYRPKTFKSKKISLKVDDIDQELKDFFNGKDI